MKKIIIGFLLILCISLIAKDMNKLSIVGKAEKINDIVPASIKDANNRKAACIVFLTDLEVDMDFRPNIELVKLISKPGRHEIYVQPGERLIEVFATGFKPLNVVLSSYGITRIESGNVWSLVVKGLLSNEITITTNPSNAEIKIAELPDSIKFSPCTFTGLPSNDYNIIISKERYETMNIPLFIEKDEKIDKDIELKPLWGDLEITTIPSGAEVILNGKKYGTTPLKLEDNNGLLSGEYNVIIIYSSEYESYEGKITINKGDKLVKNIQLTKKSRSDRARTWSNQTSKGVYSVGGSIIYYSKNFNNSYYKKEKEFRVTAEFEIFLFTNFSIGSDFSYSMMDRKYSNENYDDEKTSTNSFGVITTKYFTNSIQKPFIKLDLSYSNTKLDASDLSVSNLVIGSGIGYRIPLSNSLAIEPMISYEMTTFTFNTDSEFDIDPETSAKLLFSVQLKYIFN